MARKVCDIRSIPGGGERDMARGDSWCTTAFPRTPVTYQSANRSPEYRSHKALTAPQCTCLPARMSFPGTPEDTLKWG